jgi:hypothetical protein
MNLTVLKRDLIDHILLEKYYAECELIRIAECKDTQLKDKLQRLTTIILKIKGFSDAVDEVNRTFESREGSEENKNQLEIDFPETK